ncbi:helix-turn-helix domain-containing protein [Chitinophaga terrae (ex Kim and Jung 2007)]|uniref:helix-turn-helix domain-containing protein n=1 Tax=Chitinophaga terrae (ex Kim and Jung 2007) TaxID=408074 RepID=UPI0014576F91|nr:helix-turn-helix domain-containing protein [Chitinophaga terrae (ex Kim and Jung 2007)]
MVILITLMLLLSFQALLNAFDTRSFFLAFPHLSRISWLLPTVFGPLIYLLTYYLTTGKKQLQRRDVIHFIPFFVYLLLLLPWYLQAAADKRRLLDDFEAASTNDFGWMNQFSIAWILLYLILALVQLQRYRKTLQSVHAAFNVFQLQWLRRFIYIFLLILVVSGLAFYGRKFGLPLLSHLYHYNYALVVLALYWVAGKCITQPQLFEHCQPVAEPPACEAPVKTLVFGSAGYDDTQGSAARKYAKSGLDDAATDQLTERLLQYMDNEKPYLDRALTISSLAAALGVSRHHLSQVINARLALSFFDFINSYRIRAVQSQMLAPGARSLSLLGIAYECGFNSKATFNTSFKKFTGMTPSAYLKTQLQQG